MVWEIRIRILLEIMLLVVFNNVHSQNITETIRGKVIDNITKDPLIGANVILINSDPLVGASTGLDGSFRLDNVPVGRISLKISFIGYHEIIIDDLPLVQCQVLNTWGI